MAKRSKKYANLVRILVLRHSQLVEQPAKRLNDVALEHNAQQISCATIRGVGDDPGRFKPNFPVFMLHVFQKLRHKPPVSYQCCSELSRGVHYLRKHIINFANDFLVSDWAACDHLAKDLQIKQVIFHYFLKYLLTVCETREHA